MPYRIDLRNPPDAVLDRLIELGALDVERRDDGGLAVLLPDRVTAAQVETVLGTLEFTVSPVVARDAGSVWVLSARPVQVGRVRIVPHTANDRDAVRLVDAAAFGTGLHPTTALCLEALDDIVPVLRPEALLDVGTGSGILALAALRLGVATATAVDIDDEAMRAAAENARTNGVATRMRLVRGGPDAVRGTWPLVVANVLAAPLIEMAPVIVRRVGHHGRAVLSGIPASVEPDVTTAYRRLGLRHDRTLARGGWVAIVLQATW